ncbi:MAG: REP-associated tyrosine transposase [Chloroflexia bacterium]
MEQTIRIRRLIETDEMPIGRISEHTRKDQNIRKGHLHTLHVWWATRPLAACRAVLMATLLPDPADPNCPESFRRAAREALGAFSRRDLSEPPALRRALLDWIADFADWDNAHNPRFVEAARKLVAAAHSATGVTPVPQGPPLVVDPFAGIGSIPFEALRIGADAFAGDLNPVAVLLNKVALEYLPTYGLRLAEAVRKWGEWVRERAIQELRPFYPLEPDDSEPLAYLWARTIRCEGPGCGAEVPLVGLLWLSRKEKQRVALRYKVSRGGTGVPPVHLPSSTPGITEFKVTRRNLPHWQQPGSIYFITWRCRKGQSLAPEERTIALDAIRYWDGQKWLVYAAVIMPDHVHVLAQPLERPDGTTFDLAEILHSIKSFSAHRINERRNTRGPVWQDERYDRIVRDEEEFLEKWGYIRTNPLKEGLSQRPEDYPWLYEGTGQRPEGTGITGQRPVALVKFEIFQPRSESEVQPPIVKRFAATCPVCGYTTPYARVREQIRAKRGGTRDARLIAVITLKGSTGVSPVRGFRLATEEDLAAARRAEEELASGTGVSPVPQKHPSPLPLVPDEPLPPSSAWCGRPTNRCSGRRATPASPGP